MCRLVGGTQRDGVPDDGDAARINDHALKRRACTRVTDTTTTTIIIIIIIIIVSEFMLQNEHKCITIVP